MTQFQDAAIGETRHANQDPVDEFRSFNAESTQSSFQVTVVKRSKQRSHSLLRWRANRYDPNCDAEDAKRSVDATFDEALCAVAKKIL